MSQAALASGITENPTDEWTSHIIRSHTMDEDPLTTRKYWILDNDSKYGPKTKVLLGKKHVNTSIRAPDMNSVAERFVKSIKHECLNHVREYEKHYNEVRPHQGIGNKPIGEWVVGKGKIICDRTLNGLLKSFRRAA